MRLVVDTNVFVSAALKDNSLPFFVVRWIERHDGLLKSAATEHQLLEVLARPYIAAATIPALREGVARMLAAAELVPIVERITACRDPTDDKFLELAVNGHADLIVSGDADLLVLNSFRDIPIVTPAMFVQGAVQANNGQSVQKRSENFRCRCRPTAWFAQRAECGARSAMSGFILVSSVADRPLVNHPSDKKSRGD
jgi:uncharacterized protein